MAEIIRKAPLGDAGFLSLRSAIRQGYVEFSGRFCAGQHEADFTFRAAMLLRSKQDVDFVFYDTRIYGWLPVPAPMLPLYLRQALAPPIEQSPFQRLVVGATQRGSAGSLVASGGWKIPNTAQAGLVAAECARGRLIFAAGPEGELNQRQIAEREPPALRSGPLKACVLSRTQKKLWVGEIFRRPIKTFGTPSMMNRVDVGRWFVCFR